MKINKQKVTTVMFFITAVLGSILITRHYTVPQAPNVVYVYNIVEYTPTVVKPSLTTAKPSLSLRIEPPKIDSMLYQTDHRISISDSDRECVEKNIFHESRGEPLEGKIAVAQVTFNRLNDGRWGQSLCDVVFAKSQFSWTLNSAKRNQAPVGPQWEESKQALKNYLSGVRVTNLERGTHFHAIWIDHPPAWASKKQELAKIGQHVFYASLR